MHQTIIKNDVFSYSLSNAIMFVDNNDKISTSIIKNRDISESKHYNDLSQYGNLVIATCRFIECQSATYGGAIFVEQDCSVTIHESTFDKCHAKSGGGGYICRQQNDVGDHGTFSDLSLINVDVQYCCFQQCYTENTNEEKTGYGSALVLAGQTVVLFYASTVDCFYTDSNGKKQKVTGAQYDIQSSDVSSEYVNVTGGYSKYCGSIEYRYSGVGFFRYQTIMKMECMFVIAFSNFSSPSINITFCNLVDNKLSATDQSSETYPSMIKIIATDLLITNFVFYNNDFNAEGRLVSRDFQIHPEDDRYKDQKITLTKCYCNNYPSRDKEVFTAIDCNFLVTSGLTLNPIALLKLDKCEGEVTAPPIEITSVFTPSNQFSKSDLFSSSNIFSETRKFSSSLHFSKSCEFSNSFDFSSSNNFAPINKDPDQSNTDNKMKPAAIAGIAVGSVAAVAVIAVVVFFLVRKKIMLPREDVDDYGETMTTTNNSNPIYDVNGPDDPFKEDF